MNWRHLHFFLIVVCVLLVMCRECPAVVHATISDEPLISKNSPHCVSCWQKLRLSKLHPHENHHRRAGCPQCVACCAKPSVNKSYVGYYVGGGAVVCGEGRQSQEGVWGVDYHGMCFKRRVKLDWWHGSKHQGGTGSYKTDGPHLIKILTEHE